MGKTEMTENQAINTLLSLERSVSGRIHEAIEIILRKGYENNGKEQMKRTLESICYKTEEVKKLISWIG